jgi:hypothetical protein
MRSGFPLAGLAIAFLRMRHCSPRHVIVQWGLDNARDFLSHFASCPEEEGVRDRRLVKKSGGHPTWTQFSPTAAQQQETNMIRFLAIAAVLGTTLLTANQSEGKPNKGASGQGNSHSMHQHSRHSHHRNYRNWSRWTWNTRYGCYFYYCPTDNCEYYWYAPACCYYPVTYLAQYPPTRCSYEQTAPNVAPLPVQVTNINTNTLTNGGGVPVPPLASGPPLPKGP